MADKSPSPYDPKLALAFFQLTGESETFAAGDRVFAEGDKAGGFFSKGARIYLLLEGEVALTRNGKPLNLVFPGEIFGELAVISDAPRSATATARKPCRVLSLDEKRHLASLQRMPEFALMLLALMAERLRRGLERLLAAAPAPLPPREGGHGLDQALLAELRKTLGDPTPTPMKAGDVLVMEGAVGINMYVVTAGRVAIAVGGRVVESIGPGEIFGEMALLGPSGRAASAMAESDGAWLPVARNDFLAMVKAKPVFGTALLRSMSERIQHVSRLLGG